MNDVSYVRHNKPRLVFFPTFFTVVYIVERLVLDNLHTKQGNSLILGPKICGL